MTLKIEDQPAILTPWTNPRHTNDHARTIYLAIPPLDTQIGLSGINMLQSLANLAKAKNFNLVYKKTAPSRPARVNAAQSAVKLIGWLGPL